MKVLIIHHLEPMWNDSLVRLSGKGFFDWAIDLVEELIDNSFDKIILTQFEDWKPQIGHIETGLADFVTDWHNYAYGWKKDSFNNPNYYCEGGNHSEVVYTPEWIKALKGHEITLCGAFDGECIEDMEIALRACDVSFKRWEEFIV